jgi:monothiol glutaredoxin
MSDIKDRIKADVESNRIVLFMKGSKSFPQCGFSAQVVELLKHYGNEFETRNVLADQELRQGIKEFSDWPTIPQLYVDGKFIGGCDIVTDLHNSGQLGPLLTGTDD